MYTANLNTLDLLEGWYENDPHMRVKVNFDRQCQFCCRLLRD
jgi:hypothetical protein